MGDRYVTLYVMQRNVKDKEKNSEIIAVFKRLKIKHIIVNLSEKIDLYGNEISLEGPFAIDFSGNGPIKNPSPPLAVAGNKTFNGFEEIKGNMDYLKRNYSEL